MHLDGISGRGFSGPLPDHRFNDLKIISTIYCHHTLGMTVTVIVTDFIGFILPETSRLCIWTAFPAVVLVRL